MWAFLPIIGPIIDGVVSVVKGRQDTSVKLKKISSDEKIASQEQATRTLEIFQDDLGVKLSRDIIIFPWAVWGGLIGWDTIMAKKFPDLMWNVASAPDSVAYLPYAVIVFLLGNIGFNIWKSR